MKTKVLTTVLALSCFVPVTNLSQTPSWLWGKNAGRTTHANSICTDKEGFVYVTGEFGDSITFGSQTLHNVNYPNYGCDVYIVKYDSLGQVIWARSAGGSGCDEGISIAAGPYGDVFVTGYVSDSLVHFGNVQLNTGNPDGQNYRSLFVARYDKNGNVVWAATSTGYSECTPSSIFVDSREHIYVTGNFSGTMTFNNISLNPGNKHVFLLKLSGSGYGLWGIAGGKHVYAKGMDVSVAPSGDVYLAGNFNDTLSFGGSQVVGTGNGDIFAARFTSSGTPVWLKKFGGIYNDWVGAIGSDNNGNVFLSGSFTSPSISFGCSTIYSKSVGDIFLTKLDSSGQCVWANGYGGGCSQEVRDLALDMAGNIHIVGTYMNPQLKFGQFTLTHPTGIGVGYEMFVVKIDNNGTVLWARNSRSHDENTCGLSVAVDNFGNVYSTGVYYSTWVKFDGDTVFTQTAAGDWEAFLARIRSSVPTTTTTSTVTAIYQYSDRQNAVDLFPNPSTGNINLRFGGTADGEFDVVDVFGKIILKDEQVVATGMTLDLGDQPAGVYFLVLRSEGSIVKKKFVLRK